MEALNRRASKVRAYTTYMTIMARLHKKACSGAAGKGRPTFMQRLSTATNTGRCGRARK
jgi:hypothetical protein